MPSRITNLMLTRSVVADANTAATRLADTQKRLASGKDILRPSDDPFGTNRSLLMREQLERVNQHARNVAEAIGWQEATESAMSRITDMIHRVRELMIEGANDTSTQAGREAIATEIDQLIEAVKQEANTSYSGRFLFSGTATQTQPYAAGSDAYAGNAAAIAREIGPGVSVQVNVVGSDLLGSGQAAADNKLLHVMRDIAQHLRGGTAADLTALRGTDLQRLIANTDDVVRLRAVVGGTTNRLEAAQVRLRELEETATHLLSTTEDADMAEAMVAFSMQQSVYESALRSGASIVQASLMDFLR
jgi:flagellar hook-associated protein 3 FlgL